MADLGDLLGILMVSLARAREMADLETAAIAERYKAHPLLEGMSLPRVRVPELSMELPMLIEAEQVGEAPQPEHPEVIASELNQALEESARRQGVEIPFEARLSFEENLKVALASRASLIDKVTMPAAFRETIVRVAESCLVDSLRTPELRAVIPDVKLRAIISDVRLRAEVVAERKPGKPPRINATIMTSEVKEKAGANNVTRIRLTLREEGLEWSVVQNDDGTTNRRLQPE